jgi:hypothetical protein
MPDVAAAVATADDDDAADVLARLTVARSRLLEDGVLDHGMRGTAAAPIGLVLERQDRAAMVALRHARALLQRPARGYKGARLVSGEAADVGLAPLQRSAAVA